MNTLTLPKSLTFSNYFELNAEPEEILATFGYSFQRQMHHWPTPQTELDDLITLKHTLERRLPFVSLTSETARREILIAPILLTLVDHTQAQLRIEYPLTVSDQLKGTLDYYLHTETNLIILEAKKADLARGFTQLAVELLGLDQFLAPDTKMLWGAVSTGDIWQFGSLDRKTKTITQDLNLFRVPADLEPLFAVLLSILQAT